MGEYRESNTNGNQNQTTEETSKYTNSHKNYKLAKLVWKRFSNQVKKNLPTCYWYDTLSVKTQNVSK